MQWNLYHGPERIEDQEENHVNYSGTYSEPRIVTYTSTMCDPESATFCSVFIWPEDITYIKEHRYLKYTLPTIITLTSGPPNAAI